MIERLITLLLIAAPFGACGTQTHPKDQSSASDQTASANRGSASEERPLSADSIDEVLWWLPEDTETVSVARGPFKPSQKSEPSSKISLSESVDYALTSSHLGSLRSIRDGKFYKSIVGSTVKFCVEGSRKYRPPTQLGSMRYEGCDITVFEPGLVPSLSERIGAMTQLANERQTIAGQRVMMFEEKLEDDVWKIYVALPASNVLLCATNQDFLTQVLNRMQHREAKRALPEDLPEWKQVNTDSKIWVVRHYDRTIAPYTDPSSPVNGDDPPGSWSDTEAVGIVLDFDPNRSSSVAVKYLSRNKDALKLFSDYHTKIGQGFRPAIRLREPGVIEMIVPFDNADGGGISWLVLLTLFGHSIYT